MTGASKAAFKSWLIAAVNLAGLALSLAGLGFIFINLNKIEFGKQISGLTAAQMATAAALCMGYALANTLVAFGWCMILRDFGGHLASWRSQIIFARSNLLKYVPGNIFHLAGRQVLAMRMGVPGWASAKSISVETVLLIVSSGIVSGLLLLALKIGAVLAGVVTLLGVAAAAFLLGRSRFRRSGISALLFALYHIIGAILFLILLIVLAGPQVSMVSALKIVLAYIASWSAGMLTPGAPAGLGVREAALIGMLRGDFGENNMLVTAVVLARGVSIVADVTYFLAMLGLQAGFPKLRE